MFRTRLLVAVIPVLLTLVAGLTFSTGCVGQPQAPGIIHVAVSIWPLADFVARVGQGMVEVTVMVPPGASAHTYEPTPRQLSDLSKAQVFVKVGAGLEYELAWMDKLVAINRKMLVVDGSKGIELIGAGEHDQREGYPPRTDPHTWVSPLNAIIMVQNICDGLISVDPQNKAYYEQNRDAYILELRALDLGIRKKLAPFKGRTFIVFHSAWAYLARDYGLTEISIEKEGKEPGAQDIADVIKKAKEHNIKTIFASPQFNPQSAETIAKAIDGKVVLIDPTDMHYIANTHRVVDALAQAMK